MFPSTLTILIALLVTFIYIQRTAMSWQKQPLCPPGLPHLPIIGNLHMLESLLLYSLQFLAKLYSPIMSLKLENVPTIVVSSPEAIELFLKTHDTAFANWPKLQATEYTYGAESMNFAEYGSYWCNVRKVCTTYLLTTSKVESFASLRMQELGAMVKPLKKAAYVNL